MNFHKLLARQLNHSHLSEAALPVDLEAWQAFLQRVNSAYKESDEERYLLERSMELSSGEIMDLNSKLENAQEIAELGYWTLDVENGRLNWSKELRKMMGLDPADTVPTFQQIMQSIHPDYREKLQQCIKHTIATGEKYELEMQIQSQDGTYRWQYAVGAPFKDGKPPFNQLSGIAMDITKRKEAEQKLQDLNTQIIASAREVGMADVAVSILHNVGNVLNSVNVSSNILVENLGKSHFDKYFEVCKILREHLDELNTYLVFDEKGKLIPHYLIALADSMQENYKSSCSEVANINEKIQHIREIVMAQQSLSRVNGIFEKIRISDIVKSTLMMVGNQLADKNIAIIEDYHEVPDLYLDRAKVVQILVNLVTNAKDALIEDTTSKTNKNVTITTKLSDKDSNKVLIMIKDNGIGIARDNMQKLFAYGFSTKLHGHGIGLHSCALTAIELGGKLTVDSDGIGQGATFTLELPVSNDMTSSVFKF
jgi:PAS domain S-box-containing protein